MTTKKISDATFEKEVINSNSAVLVDFWAEWCAPCKQIAPSLDEISEEKKDKISVVKLNIDDNPETPVKYGVRGIPTLMIFFNGQLLDTRVGSSSKNSIIEWIDSLVT